MTALGLSKHESGEGGHQVGSRRAIRLHAGCSCHGHTCENGPPDPAASTGLQQQSRFLHTSYFFLQLNSPASSRKIILFCFFNHLFHQPAAPCGTSSVHGVSVQSHPIWVLAVQATSSLTPPLFRLTHHGPRHSGSVSSRTTPSAMLAESQPPENSPTSGATGHTFPQRSPLIREAWGTLFTLSSARSWMLSQDSSN